MPVATGYTHTYLKALRLGKEELHVLELKLNALIMDSIHFIDLVQQLLATDTRPFIPIFCVSMPLLPTQATPVALPFSHFIPMPLLPQGTYA